VEESLSNKLNITDAFLSGQHPMLWIRNDLVFHPDQAFQFIPVLNGVVDPGQNKTFENSKLNFFSLRSAQYRYCYTLTTTVKKGFF